MYTNNLRALSHDGCTVSYRRRTAILNDDKLLVVSDLVSNQTYIDEMQLLFVHIRTQTVLMKDGGVRFG